MQKLLSSKKENLAIMMILLLFFGISVFSLNRSLPGDSKVSVILSQSIRQWNGLRDISDIREPLVNYTAPLWPSLLSLIWSFDNPLFAGKLISVIILLLSFLLAYKILKDEIEDDVSRLLLFAILVFSPFFGELANEVSTHSVFLLISLSFVLNLKQYFRTNSRKNLIYAVLLAAAGFLTRWVGLSLFIGLFFSVLFAKKYKDLIIASLLFSLIALPWIIFTLFLHFSGKAAFFYITLLTSPYPSELNSSHAGILSFILRIIKNGGAYILRNIPSFIFGRYFYDINLINFNLSVFIKMLLVIPVVFPVCLGFMKKGLKSPEGFYIVVYLLILLAFAEADLHYLVPLSVFIYLWMYTGLKTVFKTVNNISMILSFVLIFVFLSFCANAIKNKNQHQDTVYSWIADNTPGNSVILTYKWFSPVYIYTGRRTRALMSYDALFTNPKYVYEKPYEVFKKNNGIDYVIVYPDKKNDPFKEIRDYVFANKDRFKLEYEGENGKLYSLNQ